MSAQLPAASTGMSASTSTPTPAPAPAPAPAPITQAIAAQTRAELTMTLRRGESVLVTLVIPVLVLIFFVSVLPVPGIAGRPVDFLLPGIFAVAIISTGMVSLGIATAYERYYGVLKRLGASPLPRWSLLAGKLLAVLVLEAAQVIVLVLIAVLVYQWRPAGAIWPAIPIALIGTVAFAGLGLLMAGALRAEATLAAANGLFLIFMGLGGIFLPVDHLTPALRFIAEVLPPAALANALRGALTPAGVAPGDVLLLALWAGIFVVAAALTFQWE